MDDHQKKVRDFSTDVVVEAMMSTKPPKPMKDPPFKGIKIPEEGVYAVEGMYDDDWMDRVDKDKSD